MVYTHKYDTGYAFGPALPIVEVSIFPVDNGQENVMSRALVDSGADATMIPVDILTEIDADRVGRAQMRWGSHQSKTYDVYLVMLKIGPFQILGARVLADVSGREMILGRNALNQMIVTLNGLANIVEISQ